MSKNFILEHVTLLHFLNDCVFTIILVFNMNNCVVEIRIKFFIYSIHRLNTHFFECIHELLINHFNTFFKCILILFSYCINSSLKVIDDRKNFCKRFHGTFIAHLSTFSFITASHVIELSHKSCIFFFITFSQFLCLSKFSLYSLTATSVFLRNRYRSLSFCIFVSYVSYFADLYISTRYFRLF